MIFNNSINICQFGAINCSITDNKNSTIQSADASDFAINNAIKFLSNFALNNSSRGFSNTILIPPGNYIIRSTINIPNFLHLKSNGQVTFYLDSDLDYMFKIDTNPLDTNPYKLGNAFQRFLSPIIDLSLIHI